MRKQLRWVPATRIKNGNPARQRRNRQGVSRYINWNTSADKLKPCAGCQSTDPKAFLYLPGCRVRKCASTNNLDTCAQCNHYPCKEVPKVSVDTGYRKFVEDRLGELVDEENYHKFIEVYEGIKHLDEIRGSVEVVEIETHDYKPRMKQLPENLGEDYGRLHAMIGAMHVAYGVPDVIVTVLKDKRRELVRLLYMVGAHGTLDNGVLSIPAKTYRSLKLPSELDKMNEKLETLKELGLDIDLVKLADDYASPKGGLRPHGWKLEAKGNTALLEALSTYAKALKEKHGKRGFRYFSSGNMDILT